ncbi:hypothetical protein IFT92_21905 [Peribacillus simplex]|uniref:hypothetical protein n=1 Tax=Peribacillus simplex TaxID=1478 RepID=UPI001920DDDE|nr:hypothetical protein [Peribacillus simplex]MBD8590406.1 hypothetical protein [Peribacillus simplex]
MIYVDRATVPIPSVLDFNNPDSKGSKELRDCIEHYTGSPAKAFPFSAYKDDEVKILLAKLFYNKCAYCESDILATGDIQVEHYRPKGRIKIGDTWSKNGYYWLAAEWSNLFPSCIRCNEKRIYILEDGTEVRGGKWSFFPLNDENSRVLCHSDTITVEEPLLLNPCNDNPTEHLLFLDDGVVTHLTDKGCVSIDLYALFRPGLKKRRHKTYKKIAFLMECANDELQSLITIDDPIIKKGSLVKLKKFLDELHEYTSPESEYAGFSRQFINQFMKSKQQELQGAQLLEL